MTRAEFNAAFVLAESTVDLSVEYQQVYEGGIFIGFGLNDYEPIHCTLAQVAALIRFQGLCLNGAWDMEGVNEVWRFGRHKFIIIGKGGELTANLPGQLLAQALCLESS